MKLDDETIRWLRDEARDEGDGALVSACDRALGGDLVALAACEETVNARVARAHREHRSHGTRGG
jgi:hypothetical protein